MRWAIVDYIGQDQECLTTLFDTMDDARNADYKRFIPYVGCNNGHKSEIVPVIDFDTVVNPLFDRADYKELRCINCQYWRPLINDERDKSANFVAKHPEYNRMDLVKEEMIIKEHVDYYTKWGGCSLGSSEDFELPLVPTRAFAEMDDGMADWGSLRMLTHETFGCVQFSVKEVE